MAKTAETARDIHGDKLYQERARLVLPILVRQAKARHPVFYEALAQEVGMPNPRNLNYPLGCIGRTLNNIAEEWNYDVPPIEALVVNIATRLPGPGFDGFLTEKGETWNTKAERRAIIEKYWAEIYAYPYWIDVLQELELSEAKSQINKIIVEAGKRGGGEGPDHLALKKTICANPHMVGLKDVLTSGTLEYILPSGDRIDVLFDHDRSTHAVEVKPTASAPSDLARGLFQCVKYRAVLQALASFNNDTRKISVCLALGGTLPDELIALRNTLNVDVYENLSPL